MLSETNISAAQGPEILSRFFKQTENQHCFDCDAPANEFISVNNGVSLCRKCADLHRGFGNDDISLVKSSKAEGWTLDELKLINIGGNKKLSGFLKEWDVEKDKTGSFYKTKGSYHYRRQLQYDIDGFNQPEPITKQNAREIVDGKPLLAKASEKMQDAKEAVQDPNLKENLKEKAVHLKDGTIDLAYKGIETIKSGIKTAVEKIKGVTTGHHEETKETSESLHQKSAPKENVTKCPKQRETGYTAADIVNGHSTAEIHPTAIETEGPSYKEPASTRPNRFEDAECFEKYDLRKEETPVQVADLVYRYEQEHHHLPPLELSSKDLVISQLKHHTDPVLKEYLTRASKKENIDTKLGDKPLEVKESKLKGGDLKVQGDPLMKKPGTLTKEGEHEVKQEIKCHGDPFSKEFVTRASKKSNIDGKLSDKVTPVADKKSGELTPKDSTNKGKETFSDKAIEAKEDKFQGDLLKVQGDPMIKKPVNVTKECQGVQESTHEIKCHGDPFSKEFVTRASKQTDFRGQLVTPISEKKSGELTPKNSNEKGTDSFGDKDLEAKEDKLQGDHLKVQGDPMIKQPENISKQHYEGAREFSDQHKVHGDPFMKEFVTRASKNVNIDGKFSEKVTPVADKKSGDLTPKDASGLGTESFGEKAKEEVQDLKKEAGKKENITKMPKKNQ